MRGIGSFRESPVIRLHRFISEVQGSTEGVTGFDNIWLVLTDIQEGFPLKHIEINEMNRFPSVVSDLPKCHLNIRLSIKRSLPLGVVSVICNYAESERSGYILHKTTCAYMQMRKAILCTFP